MFAGDVTLCLDTLEIPQNLVRIRKFSRVSGCKTTQKPVAFLCSGKERSKRKLVIPLTAASGRIKYLGLNVTKTVKDSDSESLTHAAGRSSRPKLAAPVFTDWRLTL